MDRLISWFAGLPAQLLSMADTAMDHPIAWVALALIPVAAFVLGGMQIHQTRADRRSRRGAATRYGNQEK